MMIQADLGSKNARITFFFFFVRISCSYAVMLFHTLFHMTTKIYVSMNDMCGGSVQWDEGFGLSSPIYLYSGSRISNNGKPQRWRSG